VSIALVITWSAPRATCWQIIAARSLSWPMRGHQVPQPRAAVSSELVAVCVTGASHPRCAQTRLRRAVDTGDLYRPSGPDGKGQARA